MTARVWAKALLAIAIVLPAHAAEFELPDTSAIIRSAALLNSPAARKARSFFAAQQNAAAVNTGFQGLGPKGTAGTVSAGLLNIGGGKYWVLENSPYLVVMKMQTGFIEVTFTLKRDPATGKDTMTVQGRVNDSGWKDVSGTGESQILYDAGRDGGVIRWTQAGKPKTTPFSGGGPGKNGMTIELEGTAHQFSGR